MQTICSAFFGFKFLEDVCINCVKGKLTNLRKKGAVRSSNLLKLIHTDICGSFPNPTHDGFRYFITFTDDFSRLYVSNN